MNEKWKDIAGLENLYQVSNLGRIRRILGYKNYNYLTPNMQHDGYLRVIISDKSKKHRLLNVHREVAIAFVPNPNNCKYAVFADGNTRNCNANNLVWTDKKSRYSKMVCQPVLVDNGVKKEIFPSLVAAGEALNVTPVTVKRHIMENKPFADGTTVQYTAHRRK